MQRLPTRLLLAASLLVLLPFGLASHSGTPGHYYGQGHADMVWTTTAIPPSVDGTGTGWLTTNLATFGAAIAFGLPITALDLHVLPAAAPQPVLGSFEVTVPPNTDPWWSTYPGGVPPGITTGGTLTFDLSGYAEHHPNAVTLYGSFHVSAATGQYSGLFSIGDWSGSSTGGGSSFGPYWDFAMMGHYA